MIKCIIFDDSKVPEGSAGCSKFWFAWIRPAYRNDLPLIAHEVEGHIRQFWRNPFKHCWKFTKWGRDEAYILSCEVEAYRIQLALIPDDDREVNRQKYAERMSTRYGLTITVDEAHALLL